MGTPQNHSAPDHRKQAVHQVPDSPSTASRTDLPHGDDSTVDPFPATGAANQVDVTRRQVELTVDITVVEQKTGRTLWDGKNQLVQGDYQPGHEEDGRRKALALLVNKVIDGVHQNW